MNSKTLLNPLKIAMIAAGCAGLMFYLAYRSPRRIEYASAQRDHSENRVVKKTAAKIGETFTAYQPAEPLRPFSAEWPCFRGINRDNLSLEELPLCQEFSEAGPRILWKKSLGEGYAGAVIANGCVYILDYIEADSADALRCFQLFTGEEIWRRSYKNPIRRNHGKSRTIPACSDGVVVTLGPAAHVMAVNAANGDLLWTKDLVSMYGCETPQWYAGQCPLIDGGRVILGIGGEKVLLAAFDLKTGEPIWETPNESGIKMSHSSVLPAVICGKKQYVYAGIGGISAVNADGKQLWQCRDWKPAVWAPTPVSIGDGRLFLTAGYGAGSAILSVSEQNGAWTAKIESEWKPVKGPASEQQTPLVIDGKLFIIQPKDAGGLRSEFLAADVSALPEIEASSGREARFGLGPYLYADHAFWIVDDEGVLHVYRYENKQFTRLARSKVLPGVDSWGPIALAGGLMIVRDSTSMVCLDLRKEIQP